MTMRLMATFLAFVELVSAGSYSSSGSSCYDIKRAYHDSTCCSSSLEKTTNFSVAPASSPSPPVLSALKMTNPCAGKKPVALFPNVDCAQAVNDAIEQSGSNVTRGYVGSMNVSGTKPIITSYLNRGLCPVNVHWHLGAEHYSVGQYDEFGVSPTFVHDPTDDGYSRRKLEAKRQGFQCHHYDSTNPKFTTDYDWKYCTDTHVGETYEVHWPHSAAGLCGTPHQWQSPFYDGVFCNDDAVRLVLDGVIPVQNAVGVEGQVFTIVNDEDYYYPDLMRGMLVQGAYGQDIAYYTGSTTGQSRSNEICATYSPITWQVDRKCHLISASSFDKMCKDMLTQNDDFSGDTHPHGARALVSDYLVADNHVRKMQ